MNRNGTRDALTTQRQKIEALRDSLAEALRAKNDADHWGKHWETQFGVMQGIKLEVQEILLELVRLKDIKDQDGKTADYERRQPAAWAAARAHVTEMMRDWSKAGGPSTYQSPDSLPDKEGDKQ